MHPVACHRPAHCCSVRAATNNKVCAGPALLLLLLTCCSRLACDEGSSCCWAVQERVAVAANDQVQAWHCLGNLQVRLIACTQREKQVVCYNSSAIERCLLQECNVHTSSMNISCKSLFAREPRGGWDSAAHLCVASNNSLHTG
jgi:hypothetical protein